MDRREYRKPIELKNCRIDDTFWSSRIEMVRKKMVPYQWEALNDRLPDTEKSHCIENFRIAAGLQEGGHGGFVFQDSDLAKWLEAVGYLLAAEKDDQLEKTADEVIDLIAQAQQKDGYLDTYYIINGLDRRFTNLCDNHELYCAGHMIEAGIAYYQGTGKRKLLDCVIRLADCIDAAFGCEEGKIHGYPGHEIIEMALVRLYHVTEEERYLRLAEYFINQRGQAPLYFAEERQKQGNHFYWKDSLFQYMYYQAGKPVREQETAEGHAVRAVYLYSGMAAVAAETGDESLLEACRRLWKNIVHRRMYITGAIGSSEYGESFTLDYDLPNDTVYGETCASIGLIFFARRMLEIERNREYADVMEKALYNTCLAGTNLDGTRFFYVNPLEINPENCRKDQRKKHVTFERQKWFACACCPPNLARLLASLGSYAATTREKELDLNLYIGGEITDASGKFGFTVYSGMPWSGNVAVKFNGEPQEDYTLALRVPGWADSVDLTLNYLPVEVSCSKENAAEKGSFDEASRKAVIASDGYLVIRRNWKKGDLLYLDFAMPVRIMEANPMVREDIGKLAVTRGPLVYCLEEKDNGKHLHLLSMDPKADAKVYPGTEFTNMKMIEIEGYRRKEADWGDCLYAEASEELLEKQTLKLIPYYAWNNRGIGEMTVWINRK